MSDASAAVPKFSDLSDLWGLREARMVNEGDGAAIDALLANELVKLAMTDGGWRTLCQHRLTGRLWELSYPNGEVHGGGPRRLRELSITGPGDWC
ncbi:Imm27 family immunity protein [Oryzibacter oryziterrae]|uniref:Imm27 family immunity protein n=1 Tax=Oryzibacter oryziterrae TaxID=2766474 RepID=UPI0036F2D105